MRIATTAEPKGLNQMTLTDQAAKFLTDRGFDLEAIATKTEIYSESRHDGDWLVIPFEQRGEVVNRKYRHTRDKRFSQDKDGKQIFWNRDVIADPAMKDLPLIITEGEMDALAAIQAGFPRVVSVPGGAPNEAGTEKHKCVEEAWNDLREVDEFILALDNDENGANLRDDLVGRFGAARCKIAPMPKGCKDLNDALMLYGDRGVQEAINRAKYVPVDGVFGLDDLPETPPLAPTRVMTMGEDFRKRIAICKGQLSFWTGWANRGKTTVMKQIMVDLAVQRQWKFAVAMLEDDIGRTLVPDMQVLYCQVQKDRLQDDDKRRANDFIRSQFKFIIPKPDEDPTVPWFLEQAEACVRRHGADMIVLDPWTDLDLQIGREGQVETEKKLISAFNRFARRFNVHVAIIAHPRKSDVIGGTKKMPSGYDISGSAHFMNKCYLGVSVQSSEDVDGLTEIWLWKSKFHDIMGKPGKFFMRFDPALKRFGEIDTPTAINLIQQAQGNTAKAA